MRIINEEEFINLVRLILFYQNNIEEYTFKFLSIIDPFSNKKAFSKSIFQEGRIGRRK